jgi:DMSO reductase family type II enzyme chaperone
MTTESTHPAGAAPSSPAIVVRRVSGRDTDVTGPIRCACYAALSELTASPHDIDSRESLREKIGVAATLKYGAGLNAVLSEFVDTDLDTLKKEYSGLFEVGSDGPPVPIREDLQTGQRSGTREELVRFYNFFNYALEEKFAWAPDHLSVQLEFMHVLCFREASTGDERLSYQLAQADFTERHLIKWVPRLLQGVETISPGSLYARIIGTLNEFLASDFAWQNGTIFASDKDSQQGEPGLEGPVTE